MIQNRPFFSIVVPTYGRPSQLAACLRSLARLDYPRGRFKVIVVDDGSETPPEGVVASFCGQLDVTLLTQPHAGPAAARNTGAAHARGEVLAFLDDDCAPTPNWLQTLAARFAAVPDRAVGGRTLNALPQNPYSAATQLLIAYLYAYYNADPSRARFFTTNNLSLPVDRFHAIGGFDITFPFAAGEDREFCDRWLTHGYRMTYAPEVSVYHAHALTFCTFWRQHFRYGRGGYHFHKVHARRGDGRIRVEPLSFYLDLLRYPFLQLQGWPGLTMSALFIVSQVANTAGFVWESITQAAATRGQW